MLSALNPGSDGPRREGSRGGNERRRCEELSAPSCQRMSQNWSRSGTTFPSKCARPRREPHASEEHLPTLESPGEPPSTPLQPLRVPRAWLHIGFMMLKSSWMLCAAGSPQDGGPELQGGAGRSRWPKPEAPPCLVSCPCAPTHGLRPPWAPGSRRLRSTAASTAEEDGWLQGSTPADLSRPP